MSKLAVSPACRALTVAVTAMVVTACAQADNARVIDAWMRCDECSEQQRQEVASLGSGAVRELDVILYSPSPSRLENARRQFVQSYQVVPGLTQEAYVRLMLDAYVARNQTRAAVSLADIATPNARAALARALAEAEPRAYRPDVVRAISGAFYRATNAAFTGSLSATSADFGDTVVVRAGGVAWDGNESVVLNGSPFASELLVSRWNTPGNDDSLSFVVAGEIGSYSLSVTGLGPNDVTQVDTNFRIRSMRYSVHSRATAELVASANLPQTRYVVLGDRSADTVDFLKLIPAAADTVTATARWPGTVDVHLAWLPCVGVPGGTTVSGRIVSPSGAGIGGAQVSVVGSFVAGTTAPSGDFSLSGVPALPSGLLELRVSRIGYQARTFRLARGTTGNLLSLFPMGTTSATTVNRVASAVAIPASACRFLQLWSPPGGRHRIVQLKIE